ncbi:MAG: DUF4446 family protein [Lachnospiraceae bacterium]|nr:DUF4446 family protein [Lachnospiraceae bacterium]
MSVSGNGSAMLNAIGMGRLDMGVLLLIAYILLIAMIIFSVYMIVRYRYLLDRYERFMKGDKAVSLEGKIENLMENVDILIHNDEANAEDIRNLYRKHETAFQKIGLYKYDAFKEMGGNLSFSLALLDEKNNGVILNSVHSSSGCYTYSKEIREGKCKIDLSVEEKQALDQAVGFNGRARS